MSDHGSRLEPEVIAEAVRSKRFLAQDRARTGIEEIRTWDKYLLREHRLLVPVDVQALYVPEGDGVPMVRLPMLLAAPEITPVADGMPAPFDEGSPRPPGVHLHWAMPDALLRGQLTVANQASGNKLGLPALPDRWVVLRLLYPVDGHQPAVTGWVIEADRAVTVPLPEWSEGGAAARAASPAGVVLPATQLTGTVGGSVVWASTYDAVLNRFALHDPLTDIAEVAPQGVDGDLATYVVAGWWKDPSLDPLDRARGTESLDELLEQLRWRPLRDWGDERTEQEYEEATSALRRALGLATMLRFEIDRPVTRGLAATRKAADAFVAQHSMTSKIEDVAVSKFAPDSKVRYTTKPWHLRASLLHGTVYGVPVAGKVDVDSIPAGDEVRVGLGQHDDDVLAALGVLPGATADQRRDAERLLEAFTFQQLSRIDSPDGLAEIEETEHTASFAAVPSGEVAGTDRFAQRVQTGGAGGLKIGRHAKGQRGGTVPARERRGTQPGAQAFKADITMGFKSRPRLEVIAESDVFREMYDKSDEILSAVEPRIVERPAPRFTFATDPLVGLRGARRSLRHGGDGRGSADGKLTCRWPHHTITEVPGLVAGADLVPSLGNGSLPSEVLRLVREAAIHDPYHDAWLTLAAAPVRTKAVDPALAFNRLHAETLLRFGANGTYDGAAHVFTTKETRTVEARAMADELRRFSLYKGADPDLVGVTCWSQPWVPLWLEWVVRIEGVDPGSTPGWRLGSVDQEPVGGVPASPPGGSREVTGRSILTTGAATTLRSAVQDYLRAEEARDDAHTGEISEQTEAALRTLAEAVVQVDISTAALSGLRDQLLGFDAVDGLVRPASAPGPSGNPAPVAPPAMLVAGHMRLVEARLVDAFGRTLRVPVDPVAVPDRHLVPGAPGALSLPPRVLRPMRWRFRLVDAATSRDTEGPEARVDQIDTSLQVSPVCGFLLPDHLDETLEVFGPDGKPLGEILHEPVGAGVLWEIAPGRPGPADSGPGYGLTDAQKALGWIAAGVIAADSAERGRRAAAGSAAPEPADGLPPQSALTALLRAVDTAMWTIDTFATFGAEHVAGLVGRPIAVVRAQLRLDVQPPTDIDLGDPARAAEWAAARSSLDAYTFPVRIGELTRTDDGVLGFFVDDDYTRLRIVDKAIAGNARASGRSRGQLGLVDTATGTTEVAPIDHPYIAGGDDADELLLHLGQRVTLTILMHPASKAHLTSGILPRKAVALARDWVAPGLAAMAPSLRTGPVLVDTDLDQEGEVRLPKVSVFGNDQDFWWRDTPATWRHDAILAATQTALLPKTPAEFREGWIRVAPPRGAPTEEDASP